MAAGPFPNTHLKMQIPASRLVEHLEPNVCLSLRNSDFTGMNPALEYAEAVRLAMRGDVEGIATKSGKVRYLRWLPEDEREISAPDAISIDDPGSATAFAQTKMGVFKEPVHEVTVGFCKETGIKRVIASGEICGYIYTLRPQPATARHAQ